MASTPPVKRERAPRPTPPPAHKHGPNAYVAKIVSLAEVFHVVQGGGHPDGVVAWVAGRQLGLITTPQLQAAGAGRGSIEWRLATGTLHRRFRGVYLVGHAVIVPGATELAAVLACGESTFVSHRSAAALWGFAAAPADAVEVTVVRRHCRPRAGLRVHQVQMLDPRDRRERRGIPVTSPAWTIIDFTSGAGAEEAERAMAEAFALRLVSEAQIRAACDRAPNRAGVAQVRAIMGQPGGPSRTRSGGERAMLRLIRAAHLPAPRTDMVIAGFTADFCWPDQRLIVEVDGHPFHSSRPAIERDHRRDLVHREAGYEVLRFTAKQLEEAPVYVATVIARALDRRSRTRG